MHFSCLHTHTNFCDGKNSIEDFCETAYKKGLTTLGFSAHAPLPSDSGITTNWHLKPEKMPQYVEAIHEARQRWKGKLIILLGLEIDYIQGICGPADHRFDQWDLDYSIGSVHYLVPENGTVPFTVDGPSEEWEKGVQEGYNGDYEAAAFAYWNNVQQMVMAGGFEIAGHLDLVKKNRAAWWNGQGTDVYYKKAQEVIQTIANTPLIVEVNTGGLNRALIPETYPSLRLLQMLKQYDVPVMINADAHQCNEVDGNYLLAQNILRKAGYTYTMRWKGKSIAPKTSRASSIQWEREYFD